MVISPTMTPTTSSFNIQARPFKLARFDSSPFAHNVRMIGRFHQRDNRLWKMHVSRFPNLVVNKAWVMRAAEQFYCSAGLRGAACIPSKLPNRALSVPILQFSITSEVNTLRMKIQWNKEEKTTNTTLMTTDYRDWIFPHCCSSPRATFILRNIFP